MSNQKMSPWELASQARDVMEDIGLNTAEFYNHVLSITIDRDYVSCSGAEFEFKESVHLTANGFKIFMKHVRERSEQIGEEVREPISTPLEGVPGCTRVSWLGVPGVDVFTLAYPSEWEGK